ncbi:MAG: TatD DNase family protein [Parcubacteria group bacterium Gr01-1014_3]|nr:MAG: TatD DNase family protein [Parcubacteria group bacterium Gr01-1014_3]
MKLFDAHTHIHFPLYDADREAVIKRAKEAGVKMLCVGTQAASSEAAVELARKNPREVWAAAGFHPNHFASSWYHDKKEQPKGEREEFDAQRLRKIAENPEVVAIGEFGLDYYRLTDELKEKENQQEAFQVQANIAKDLQKAMMLHCRPAKGTDDAYIEADRILSTFENLPPRIFHFYVGSMRITKKLVEAGSYFTFGGVITFSRDYDEIIKYIPLDRILLETDAPYVAPMPYRGKRNEPAYIIETAKKLAEIKGISADEAAEQTTVNGLKVFRI